MARDFKEKKQKVSEGHFVLLLPVRLVLDSGDELELSVCVQSLCVSDVFMYIWRFFLFILISSRTSQVEGKADSQVRKEFH